jgi:hypothetical protein
VHMRAWGRIRWGGQPHSPELLRKLAGPALPIGARQAAPAVRREVIAGAVQGMDVASYQHPSNKAIDWPSVAADGIRFAGVKATEGAYYQHTYAPGDLAGARVNPQSGLCLAGPGSSAAKGTAIQIATCTQIPGEQWRIQ